MKYYMSAVFVIGLIFIFFLAWNFRFHPKLIYFFPYESKTAGHFAVVNRVQKYFNLDMGEFRESFHQEIYYNGEPFDIKVESKYGPEERLTLVKSTFVINAIVLRKDPAAILVRAGKDMDNDSAFVMLTEKNGKVDAVTLARANMLEFTWLDKAESITAKFPFSEIDFSSGDLLYIELQTILNTKTLEYHKLKSPNLSGGAAFVGWSPDRNNMARFTYGSEGSFILNNNIKTGEFSKHGIDPEIMWFDLSTQVDADWLNHYFEWVKDGPDSYALIERNVFLKRPYRGYYSKDSNGLQLFKIVRFNIDAFNQLEKVINKFLSTMPKKESSPFIPPPPPATGSGRIRNHEIPPKPEEDTILEYKFPNGKINIYLSRKDGLSISISDPQLETKLFQLVAIIHQYVDRNSH